MSVRYIIEQGHYSYQWYVYDKWCCTWVGKPSSSEFGAQVRCDKLNEGVV